MISSFLLICVFSLTAAAHDGGAIFASMHEQQNLATRISCQVEEAEHFEYSSEVQLWDSMGGNILIQADILLHCLGADVLGQYGSNALKYNVQISNLRMVEGNERAGLQKRSRKKRGAKEFFQKSWNKVKKFFNKIFGRNTPEETTRSGHDSKPDIEEVLPAEDVYSTPFQLVQLANGSIPEIRFSENEVEDERVRNFKRHVADAFSTHLDLYTPPKRLEKSVLGEHTCNYNISYVPENKVNIAGWSSTLRPEGESLVVVKKFVSEDDIVTLAPSSALNDKDRMDLESHQTQVFRDGKMISSKGRSSLVLVSDDAKVAGGPTRRKRDKEEEEDATSYISTRTSFDIQLRRRRRRSAEEVDQLKQGSFTADTREAQVDGRGEERKRLRSLQNSVQMDIILQDLNDGKHMQEMLSLQEMVEREVSLDVDEEENSLCAAVRRIFNLQKIEEMCERNFTQCKDYLQLISLAGGPTIEKIFLLLLQNSKGQLSTAEVHYVANVVSDIPRPSEDFVTSFSSIVKESSGTPTGALAIGLSNVASKSGAATMQQVSALFANLLSKQKSCDEPQLIDLLEAVGNVGCDGILSQVLKVSAKCKDNNSVQIATAHALRHSCQLPAVHDWIEEVLKKGDCDLVKEVVASLMDKIQEQEMSRDVSSWPRFHFENIDELLENHLREKAPCSNEDILLYFSKKRNSRANEVARNLFGPESEPWEPKSSSRQKRRAPWDSVNCNEWTEDTRYTPIQSKDEFASDRSIYTKRKSCLGFRRLGVKGANAEIYAGMFAGVKEASDPPKYKLFTKFVSGVNFLGNEVEIGSFYFYLQDGKTKAYVRIMGKTRQEFTNEGCTPTELKYRPLKHIPLYLVSIGNLQLSLGIHLSSSLAVDTECPDKQVYQMQPLTNVRVGGEALGTVLFMRGSANLGANFNYKLQFTFSPWPDMCLKVSHGYDPMNINFESYFQLWNSGKQDWGKLRMWKPSFMSWQIREGRLKQWFDDTCIVTSKESAPPGMERELE